MSFSDSALASFASLGVPTALIDPLFQRGISTPFPIQSATLPDTLAGRDVLGRGRTGSGKTLAFSLPLVARLAGLVPSAATIARRSRPGAPRGLVLAPTRELANQIVAAVGAALGAIAVSRGAPFTNYVDSALVLLACALVVPVPVKLVRHGVNELLEGLPDRSTMAALEEAVATVTASLDLPQPQVRATKLGLKVYLDVRYVVASPDLTIGFEDQVRRAMADAVAHLPLDVWATVQLTLGGDE